MSALEYTVHIIGATITVTHDGQSYEFTAPAGQDVRAAAIGHLIRDARRHGHALTVTTSGDQGTHRLSITAAGDVAALPAPTETDEAPSPPLLNEPAPVSAAATIHPGIPAPAAAAAAAPVFRPRPAEPARNEAAEAIPDATEISARRRRPVAVLEAQTGQRIEVTGPVVIGRHARTGQAGVQLTDPTGTVSRTHLTLEPADDHLVVTDLGSVNGTAVTTADGDVQQQLNPHRPHRVADGARLLLGDLEVNVRLQTGGTR